MTDPKPTTNGEIALELGWKRAPSSMLEGWIDPNGIELGWVETLPDFEHNWAHAGPLWAELVAALTLPGAANYVWKMLPAGVGWSPSQDELMTATSRAWLAWKKEGA